MSSGVELAREKDDDLVRRFIQAAKGAAPRTEGESLMSAPSRSLRSTPIAVVPTSAAISASMAVASSPRR